MIIDVILIKIKMYSADKILLVKKLTQRTLGNFMEELYSKSIKGKFYNEQNRCLSYC